MNTEKSPLISVIVPVYKVEKYLPACLDSLLAQTYRNFELIVVNDGSPDSCWQIMQRYAAQDARVRIFNKENGGVSSARNFGLDVARGEYIGFVDSDDLVLPQYLEWLYDALCSCGTRMSMCRYRGIQENQSLWTVTECPAPQRITAENYSWMREWSGGHCWRMLTHREILRDIRFDPALLYGEDTLFFVMEFLKAGSLAFLNCPLYAYLERPALCSRISICSRSIRPGRTSCWQASCWQRSSRTPSAVLRISAASCPAPRCISGWSTSRSGTRKRKKHCWSWLPRTATLRGRSRRSTKARSCRR